MGLSDKVNNIKNQNDDIGKALNALQRDIELGRQQNMIKKEKLISELKNGLGDKIKEELVKEKKYSPLKTFWNKLKITLGL